MTKVGGGRFGGVALFERARRTKVTDIAVGKLPWGVAIR
jgi:hypothetical protein